MAENQKRILKMLAEQKITVEEAERLLTLTASEGINNNTDYTEGLPRKRVSKYLRVEVRPGPGTESSPHAERINIRIPINLIHAGIKLTALNPPYATDKMHEALKEKGVDFDLQNLKIDDIEKLIEALSDLEVDVESGKEKVHVYVE
ncbi:MAG: hypothetical protein PHQ86_04135 [Dehalococcoidales bacterium]|nr:hypothetical protein [Dehalococcoidales bacterium]